MTAVDLKKLKDINKWVRLLYMILFAFIMYFIVIYLILLVALFQLVHALFTGKCNANVVKLGHGLSSYISQLSQFLTYTSETKPFPFGKWPS